MLAKSVAGFEKRSGSIPLVVHHTFDASPDGQLLHFINGYLRATVPPEGWKDYAEMYPEAQDIIDALTIKPDPMAALTNPQA